MISVQLFGQLLNLISLDELSILVHEKLLNVRNGMLAIKKSQHHQGFLRNKNQTISITLRISQSHHGLAIKFRRECFYGTKSGFLIHVSYFYTGFLLFVNRPNAHPLRKSLNHTLPPNSASTGGFQSPVNASHTLPCTQTLRWHPWECPRQIPQCGSPLSDRGNWWSTSIH